jgi:putative transcriptional regulator
MNEVDSAAGEEITYVVAIEWAARLLVITVF